MQVSVVGAVGACKPDGAAAGSCVRLRLPCTGPAPGGDSCQAVVGLRAAYRIGRGSVEDEGAAAVACTFTARSSAGVSAPIPGVRAWVAQRLHTQRGHKRWRTAVRCLAAAPHPLWEPCRALPRVALPGGSAPPTKGEATNPGRCRRWGETQAPQRARRQRCTFGAGGRQQQRARGFKAIPSSNLLE
jgi:hypothetical protein